MPVSIGVGSGSRQIGNGIIAVTDDAEGVDEIRFRESSLDEEDVIGIVLHEQHDEIGDLYGQGAISSGSRPALSSREERMKRIMKI